MKNLSVSVVVLVAILAVGCRPDPIVEPPLPPVPVPDCSYNHTAMVVDTSEFPPTQNVISIQYLTYVGYEIMDISISPNNPNRMAVAIGISDPLAGWRFVLMIIDLCTGDKNIIHSSDRGISAIDWGSNDQIIFLGGLLYETVFTINPDGNELMLVPYQTTQRGEVEWTPDGQSFLISADQSTIVSQVGITGSVLSEEIDMRASDYVYIPDGRIAYILPWEIGIFDPTDNSTQVLEQVSLSSDKFDIAYSPLHDALLWTAGDIVALTDLQTGQRTELTYAPDQPRVNYLSTTSKNGYLAYMTRVTSLALSNAAVWYYRDELRFINPDGTDERVLTLDLE